jgi:cytochrome c peroxidase
VPEFGFSGAAPVASTLDGIVGHRRAPSLYGVTAAKELMWDGRAADLDHQLLFPLEGPEMQIDWPRALFKLNDTADISAIAREYAVVLDRDIVLAALAAYVRALDNRVSRFDMFYRGNAVYALSDQEKRGFRIFQRKARCSSCHLIDNRGDHLSDGRA